MVLTVLEVLIFFVFWVSPDCVRLCCSICWDLFDIDVCGEWGFCLLTLSSVVVSICGGLGWRAGAESRSGTSELLVIGWGEVGNGVGAGDRCQALAVVKSSLQQKQAEAGENNEKESLGEEIAQLDQRIDGLVYELYGLTEEEIAIVEKELGEKEKGA